MTTNTKLDNSTDLRAWIAAEIARYDGSRELVELVARRELGLTPIEVDRLADAAGFVVHAGRYQRFEMKLPVAATPAAPTAPARAPVQVPAASAPPVARSAAPAPATVTTPTIVMGHKTTVAGSSSTTPAAKSSPTTAAAPRPAVDPTAIFERRAGRPTIDSPTDESARDRILRQRRADAEAASR